MIRETAKRKRSKPRLTLENGKGTTYENSQPTLYGHSPYDKGSVLYGQDRRVWLGVWEFWDQALTEMKACGLKFEDLSAGYSTHVPISQVVAHLPRSDGEFDDMGDW